MPNSDPAVGHEVEGGDALGHPGGVIEPHRQLHDAVPEPDALPSAGSPRPGTPRAPTSASTPRGSGARPPRRNRSPVCRPARPAPGRPSGDGARSPRTTGGAAGTRRRCRISCVAFRTRRRARARAWRPPGVPPRHGRARTAGGASWPAVTRRPRCVPSPCSTVDGPGLTGRAGRSGPGRPPWGAPGHRPRAEDVGTGIGKQANGADGLFASPSRGPATERLGDLGSAGRVAASESTLFALLGEPTPELHPLLRLRPRWPACRFRAAESSRSASSRATGRRRVLEMSSRYLRCAARSEAARRPRLGPAGVGLVAHREHRRLRCPSRHRFRGRPRPHRARRRGCSSCRPGTTGARR